MTLAPPARVASIPLRCSIAASSSSSDMDLTPLRASSAHQPVRASRSWCACSRPSLRLWMLGLRVKMLSCRVLKPFAVFSSRRSQYRSQSSREPNRRLSTWQLDRLLDPSAPDEERQSRKRRLLKRAERISRYARRCPLEIEELKVRERYSDLIESAILSVGRSEEASADRRSSDRLMDKKTHKSARSRPRERAANYRDDRGASRRGRRIDELWNECCGLSP
jgi:hypothetical protein